jgi:hypothetical protein
MKGPGQLVRRYTGWASLTGRKTPLLEGKSKHDGSRWSLPSRNADKRKVLAPEKSVLNQRERAAPLKYLVGGLNRSADPGADGEGVQG